MFEKLQKLEITAQEIAVIEAALHTQAKILNVQADAGGHAAREQLNQVKRVLANVAQQTPCEGNNRKPCRNAWFGMRRIFG